MESGNKNTRRLPRWMKMQMPKGESYSKVKNTVKIIIYQKMIVRKAHNI